MTSPKSKAVSTVVGHANHIFSDGEIASLEVKVIEPNDGHLEPFISISSPDSPSEGIIISCRREMEELNAIVMKAIDLHFIEG